MVNHLLPCILANLPVETCSRGFLLRKAMKCTETPDEVGGVEGDNRTGRKTILQNSLGAVVVYVAEGGQEDDLVGDVKIGVTGGEVFVLENDGRRHRQLNDAQIGFAQALAVG